MSGLEQGERFMSIKDSIEYHHMVAQGIHEDAAWGAVWIDRAYNHLLRNGMSGDTAYVQAVATYAAHGLDFDATTPEDIIYYVMRESYQALTKYPSLDPQQPEASYLIQHRPAG